MTAVMRAMMSGKMTDAQIGALLMAMRIKGETVTEITAAVQVMRELAVPVHVEAEYLVDTCGTGGDGANLFNISTAQPLLCCLRRHVAKHGNRSASGTTVVQTVEAAGVNLALPPERLRVLLPMLVLVLCLLKCIIKQ